MNASPHAATGIAHHAELMAGAICHLRNAMETGSRRSCAVACILFSCLARDETLGEKLCEECREMGECLEGQKKMANWSACP